jgi:hypothetical protein
VSSSGDHCPYVVETEGYGLQVQGSGFWVFEFQINAINLKPNIPAFEKGGQGDFLFLRFGIFHRNL